MNGSIAKLTKVLVCIAATLLLFFVISMLVPVSFPLHSIPSHEDREYYIIQYSRIKRRWFVLGDRSGLFGKDVVIKSIARRADGKPFGFENEISVDLYMQGDATSFIVYGSATRNDEWEEKYYGDTSEYDRYTIDSIDWQIYGSIHSTNKARMIFPNSYMNIYDLRWFDILRDKIFYYLDGSTDF